jgi:hypothetical protein
MKLSWQKKSCPKSLTLVGYACSLQTTGCSEVIVNEVAVFEVFRCLPGDSNYETLPTAGEAFFLLIHPVEFN